MIVVMVSSYLDLEVKKDIVKLEIEIRAKKPRKKIGEQSVTRNNKRVFRVKQANQSFGH